MTRKENVVVKKKSMSELKLGETKSQAPAEVV